MRLSLSGVEVSDISALPDNARELTLEGDAIGEGGFGAVYRVRELDGRPPAEPLVAKLFSESPTAKACHDNVHQLQEAMREHVGRAPGAVSVREDRPGLLAFPLLSFETTLNGKPRTGYVAADLSAAGYVELERILEGSDCGLYAAFQKLTPADRVTIGLQLTDAFDLLREFSYIHADLKADAIFLDLKRKRLAIIDMDSGARMDASGKRPTTWGTKQSWLAPEVRRQVTAATTTAKAGGPVRVSVDLAADVWSVNCALHTLLFGYAPYAALTELSENSLRPFANAATYTPVPPGYAFATPDRARLDKWFVAQGKRFSPAIVKAFATSFTQGITDPSQRTSYGQWRTLLGQLTTPPTIVAFAADRLHVDTPRPVTISWSTHDGARTLLDGRPVAASGSRQEEVRTARAIRLEVVGPFGKTAQTLVFTVARITPDITSFGSDLGDGVLRARSPYQLHWDVRDAENVEIDQRVGAVGACGGQPVPAHRTPRRYTLTATSYFGQTAMAVCDVEVDRTPPAIESFAADTGLRLDVNRPVTLSWVVRGAEAVSLDPAVGTVAATGRKEVDPRTPTRYRLTATSYFRAVATRNVVVDVSQRRPLIRYFRASAAVISAPRDITFAWAVDGAEDVEFALGDAAAEAVAPLGSVSRRLDAATPARLIARSCFGVEAEATWGFHEVLAKATIGAFLSRPVDGEGGVGLVELRWAVRGARDVIISPSLGKVATEGRELLSPKHATPYTLVATNARGRVSKQEIVVYPNDKPPRILEFGSSPRFLRGEGAVQLVWRVEGAAQVFIDPLGERPAASGTETIDVRQTTTYRLTAYNAHGTSVRRAITIRLLAPRLVAAAAPLRSSVASLTHHFSKG